MRTAAQFFADLKAMLPPLPDEMLGLSDDERRTFGHSNADRRYLLLRRGIVYLLREVMVDEAPTVGDKIRFAQAVTRPEYIRDPEAGIREMDWLATKESTSTMRLAYSLASDVFYAGRAGKDSPLNTDATTQPTEATA